MNDIELAKRQDIALAMSAVELAPLAAQNEIALQTYTKVPLSRVTALGAGLEPVVAAVQQVASKGQAVSGYYKVTIPAGTHLAAFKDGSGLLGTAMNETGIAGQARLNPLLCDPTMLFVAAAMANIDKKLDSIQETQQEMRSQHRTEICSINKALGNQEAELVAEGTFSLCDRGLQCIQRL